MNSQAHWFAIYTAPRAEKQVADRLTKVGIENYLPTQKRLKQWSDRKKWVEEPLFRSYLFVHIAEADYYRVLNTYGVVKYVSFGGQAAVIPDRQIETVRRLLQESSDLEVTHEKLETGAPVEVSAGPLMGTIGELLSYRGEKRVAVKIHTIDSTVLINLPDAYIEPLEDPQKLELLESMRSPKFAHSRKP